MKLKYIIVQTYLPLNASYLTGIKKENSPTKKQRGRKRKVPKRFDGDTRYRSAVLPPTDEKPKDLYDTLATYALRNRGKGDLSLSLKVNFY